MSMIDMVGTVVSGVLSGGATGLLGIALQQWGESRRRVHDIELVRLQMEQARELQRIDAESRLELARLGADAAERLADLDAAARADALGSADMRASFEADRATYLQPEAQQQSRTARVMMALVDMLRGFVRPAATVYSLVLLTLLMLWVQRLYGSIGPALSPAEVVKLATEVVGTITYLAVTCTVWWFGVRPASRGVR